MAGEVAGAVPAASGSVEEISEGSLAGVPRVLRGMPSGRAAGVVLGMKRGVVLVSVVVRP